MNRSIFGLGLLLLLAGPFAAQSWGQNDHYPQFMDMGNRAYAGEKYDLAKDYYQSALDDNSDCWQAYVGLGNCAYAKGNLKEALKNYETALKMNPDNPTLERFLQALRYKMGIFPTPTPRPMPALPTPIPGVAAPPGGVLTPAK